MCLDFVECSRALSRSNHNLVTHEKYSKTVNIICFVFYKQGITVYKSFTKWFDRDFGCLCGRAGSGGPNAERIAQRIVRAPKADSIHQSEGINPCTKNYPPAKSRPLFRGRSWATGGTIPTPSGLNNIQIILWTKFQRMFPSSEQTFFYCHLKWLFRHFLFWKKMYILKMYLPRNVLFCYIQIGKFTSKQCVLAAVRVIPPYANLRKSYVSCGPFHRKTPLKVQ